MAKTAFDIILIAGDAFADHPLNGAGLLKRFMEAHGFSMGVIAKPDWKGDADFQKLGRPRLCFGITSGPVDSMLRNYTHLKRDRREDPNAPQDSGMPDRAVTVYANKVRQLFPGSRMVLGGVEASLRRFSHYDFWSNRVRGPILADTRADILVYGPGEYPLLEIARRLRADPAADLAGIPSTCVMAKIVPEGFTLLPSHAEAAADPAAFCRLQAGFTNAACLAQQFQDRFMLQFKGRDTTPAEMDAVYDLPFTREIPPEAADLAMARFSVVLHRGCLGGCHFCSLALLEGGRIVSRSEDSIVNEITRMTRHPEWKGFVDDLGGPSANMYGMDCACGRTDDPRRDCLTCPNLDRTNGRLIALMERVRTIPGVKKAFIRSGIRFDLASDAYLAALSAHHVSGTLKIAPEHFSRRVLACMHKDCGDFDAFRARFAALNSATGQELKYYLMVAHPGEEESDLQLLRRKVTSLHNTESVQVFIPLPMTVSACMFHTGRDPFTLQPVSVVRTFHEKKRRLHLITEETRKGYRRR
ncbi:MAG: YgiQ family radical SAM protein [Planctomycetota bacterium]